MRELQGRVAVITGGGSGIGAALSGACADRGMGVVVADVEGRAAEEVARSLRERGGDAIGCEVDVRDRDAIESLADVADEYFGKCHLLCNNAGVMVTRPVLELAEKDWEWSLSVNLWGVIHATSVFLPRMLAHSEGGHIVNTASIVGLAALAQGGLGAYTTTKFALVGFSEYLREELRTQGAPIGVSVVCPGAVTTRIAESERNRPPELDVGTVPVASESDPRATQTPGKQSSEEVAEAILAGVEADDTWILTHPEMKSLIESRSDALLAAFDAAALRRAGLRRGDAASP
jgi:NAD(P)-dependent dehydrogenase (short-subunit alcohol dehydrogenase family)